MMEQLHLPLTHSTDFSKYSYHCTKSNEHAFSLVQKWPHWDHNFYFIFAPKGYGKTHLAHILSEISKGVFYNAVDLSDAYIADISTNTYIIDNCEKGDPTQLFHFYNRCLQTHSKVVFLGENSPHVVDFGLPDLNSRLRSLVHITIDMPDDDLCLAVIKKHFSDLQLDVSEEVIHYLLKHGSRDLGDIRNLIQTLNSLALSQKRTITIPFIKEVTADVL